MRKFYFIGPQRQRVRVSWQLFHVLHEIYRVVVPFILSWNQVHLLIPKNSSSDYEIVDWSLRSGIHWLFDQRDRHFKSGQSWSSWTEIKSEKASVAAILMRVSVSDCFLSGKSKIFWLNGEQISHLKKFQLLALLYPLFVLRFVYCYD